MALRGKEETFVRRFAARGNDGVPFNPRGYGDHSRRFAARGNEIVDHENFRESCDGYHPRRFATRGNEDPDLIYDSSPVYDEYEDDEWYSWATVGVLGETIGVQQDEKSLTDDGSDSGTVLLDESEAEEETRLFFDEFRIAAKAKNNGVVAGDVLRLEYPCNLPKNNKVRQVQRRGMIILQKRDVSIDKVHGGVVKTTLTTIKVNDGLIIPTVYISPSNLSIKVTGPQLHASRMGLQNKFGHVTLNNNYINMHYILISDGGSNVGPTKPIVNAKGGLMNVNKRWSSAPFDPGGIRPKLGETTREVKLFRRVTMIIIYESQVDVSFDPGGFGSKTKLEDEFFSKTGSMMQENLNGKDQDYLLNEEDQVYLLFNI
ncbi:hypothetical protein HanIR_Chr16g0820111 [Helianthus annuus]|nr:hypothetical protein HanIR_Chr16g0820111 [Helianthus annuus]